jgi:hypothetical protein
LAISLSAYDPLHLTHVWRVWRCACGCSGEAAEAAEATAGEVLRLKGGGGAAAASKKRKAAKATKLESEDALPLDAAGLERVAAAAEAEAATVVAVRESCVLTIERHTRAVGKGFVVSAGALPVSGRL